MGFSMGRLIIQEAELLRFCTPYHSDTMDQLSKDLSHALDESSDRRIREGKARRSKVWKCRSHIKSKSGLNLGSSVSKSSAKSEDSESSLDTWIHGPLNFSVSRSYHHTDSDDRFYCVNQADYHLMSWRHCSPNLVESDSVNENVNPSQEPRRKRKFKRMTVDPPFVTESKSCTSAFSQKNKRLRNLKSSKISAKSPKISKIKTVSQLSSKMENICMEFGNAATSIGKRKRCAHERSVECNGCSTISCKDNSELVKISFNPFNHLEYCNSKSQEINSSGLSSSESECGILTNDEGREADDEQSDFFQESGSACDTPNFPSWWGDDCLIPNDEFSNAKFQEILSESFCDMSAKEMCAIQAENYKGRRLVRAGRRRLGNKMTCTDEVLPYLPLTNEYNCFLSPGDNCIAKTMLNEKKKRKGMPSVHGYGGFPANISETSGSFNVLKKSVWKPVIEVGGCQEALLFPTKPSASNGKQEMRFVSKADESAATVPLGKPCSSLSTILSFVYQKESS